MRITSYEIRRVPPCWVWLIIHTDTEHIGLGEPYLEGHAESVIAETERLMAPFVGTDPLRREAHWQAMYRGGSGYRGGPVSMSAISGIDMALWDLAGKAHGTSVAELLGGRTTERVRMYRALGPNEPWFVEPGLPYSAGASAAAPRDDRDAWLRSASAAGELGFDTVKVHVSLPDGVRGSHHVDDVIDRFGWVREALGPKFEIAIDIHDPHHRVTTQLLAGLEQYRPLFVEEPVPQEQIGALADLARTSRIPLAGGERWMGKWAFFEALRTRALSVVQPDIAHAGGITELKKIAALAEAVDAEVAPHCPLSPIALAASIQLDACIPNALVQEHNEVLGNMAAERYTIGAGYLREPFELDDGHIVVPDQPGLGIDLSTEGLERIQRHPWSATRRG